MRWFLRFGGILLMVIGLLPLTPFVFLLVFVKGNPGGIFNSVHLQFWQTQSIGAGLAGVGWLMLRRSHSLQ